jgi:hypothetical protein
MRHFMFLCIFGFSTLNCLAQVSKSDSAITADSLRYICRRPWYVITDESNHFHPERSAGDTISVFNKWGKLVFESTDPDKSWDGGNEPAGTYYWVIRFKDAAKRNRSGTVTILRGH